MVWPQTRATLRPARIWAGYFLFATASFLVLIVVAVAVAPPAEEQAASVTSVPQVTPQVQASTPVVVPVWTSTEDGLGVSRRTLQRDLEGLTYNPFKFSEPQTGSDGSSSVLALSQDGKATVKLKGPPGDITEVYYLFFISGGIEDVEHMINMAAILKLTTPSMAEPLDWLTDTLEDIQPNGNSKVYREDEIIELGMDNVFRNIGLSITPR